MSLHDYVNFDLLLHAGDNGYVARVLPSGVVGDASASFTLPFDFDPLGTWLSHPNLPFRDLRISAEIEVQAALDAH